MTAELGLWQMTPQGWMRSIQTLGAACATIEQTPGPWMLERLDQDVDDFNFADMPQPFHVWDVVSGAWRYLGAHPLEDIQFFLRFGAKEGFPTMPQAPGSAFVQRDPGPFFLMRV